MYIGTNIGINESIQLQKVAVHDRDHVVSNKRELNKIDANPGLA